MATDNLTYPNDYRVICDSTARPIVVGGQAVNLWAITFLGNGDPKLGDMKFGSEDLDVLSSQAVHEFLQNLPAWRYHKAPLWAFGDGRAATAASVAVDGRPLLCEVITSVPGLTEKDLGAVEVVSYQGAHFKTLDPIAMLKAKAYCVAKFDQTKRHDRMHLKLIARCVPAFLRQIHQQASTAELQNAATKIVSRAFEVATDPKIGSTLRKEGIAPSSLIPIELASSPIEKIRTACSYQMPRLPSW